MPGQHPPDWALLIVERGRFSYRVGVECCESSRGSYVVCPPGMDFHRVAIERPMKFHYILFQWPGDWSIPGLVAFWNFVKLAPDGLKHPGRSKIHD